MKPYLLDVNALFALLWPNHIHCNTVHKWFHSVTDRQWASCPTTQSGFIRLCTNAKATGAEVRVLDAVDTLNKNLAMPNHIMLTESSPTPDVIRPLQDQLTGYKQITDAYLFGLAIEHDAVFATLDQKIKAIATKDVRKHLEVIPLN